MKHIYLVIFLLITTSVQCQNLINWDGIYKLQLSDFQSKSTQIGNVSMYSLNSSATMDFAFQMSNYEFMFTKNFNSKVTCTFTKDQAVLIAPDDESALCLLGFAQYDFDLCELYTRKFRKKMYEGKGVFSDASFFQPIYDEVRKGFVDRQSSAGKETEIGRDKEKLKVLHDQVLREIEELAEFCKSCKPSKKKKQSTK